ncbi:four helix bundle protein [Formosa sp. A9]|uniref:four helix bundle protein n=1 Tax=Formosa sp. A9 TaxID=3442641 RepID=UPI003EBD86AB
MKSYKDLDIYNLAFEYALEVHQITLLLPKFEVYEQGSQVRRSSKSIKDNIVEGYGRKRYKQDFIKHLVYAHASLLECVSQLEMIQGLYPEIEVAFILEKYDALGAKLFKFINYVESNWKT